MPDPLCVALLTAKMSPAAGGLAVSVPELAHALEAFNDVSTHVLGTYDPAHPMAAQAWGPRVQALTVRGYAALQRAPGMADALARLAPDIIDVQGLWTWSSKVNLDHHRRTGTPYVVTPRGMLDPWALTNSAWKKHLFAAFAETAHLRSAKALRATADMEARHFRSYGLKNPIAVVPNGIDLPALAPRPDGAGRRRRLLFLSRLHPKKGIDHLLRAWVCLRGEHPDWELVIAGPDEVGHRAHMQRLAADLGARDVIWHEAVQGEAKSALYRSADLFVLPTHAENFGLVVAEALAHEVPVITTKNAPWDGLERNHCGWWIELSDDALVEAIDEAMSLSDADRHAMGERGRAWMARDFTWPAVARQMHEVYTWVLGGGPPPSCVITD